MSIRRVYRWEDRSETLKYLIVYTILWITNLVLPGILAAIVYFILYRRLHAPSIADLRQEIKRTEDLSETAMTLSEFIEKRGDQEWVDPLIEDVGPWLMVQLADLANLMETIRNFYEWRVPGQTAKTLGLLTIGLLAACFTPINILMRLSTLMSGITFFALFPIGSRFPEYRLLVSPLKWLLWNIPTHAEWAILSLQAEGERHRNATSSHVTPKAENLKEDHMGYQGPPTNAAAQHQDSQTHAAPSSTEDYGAYSCSYEKNSGKLVLNAQGVYFLSSLSHKQHFSLPYENIDKLGKVVRMVSKGLSKNSGEDLKIIATDGREYMLNNVKGRDQAFSQIVGFSQVKWQVVW